MDIASFQIAKKICELSDWRVTNLSLQKIIYFCHMIYLGKNRNPLIDALFEAWDYGPVLPCLYSKLRIFGSSPINPIIFCYTKNVEDEEINTLLNLVGNALVKREAWQLVSLTHSKTGAWSKNYLPGFIKIIPNTDILDEYKIFIHLLEEYCQSEG